jgi:hypothetical protein
MKKIEVNQKCRSCKGTGLYKGLAEGDDLAVVCHTCKGEGSYKFTHTYEEAGPRILREGITRVIQYNPGIMAGEGNNYTTEDFGGVSYEEWLNTGRFPEGTEMRKFVVDYDKKPRWNECIGIGTFSQCAQFPNKSMCWLKWDHEFKSKEYEPNNR